MFESLFIIFFGGILGGYFFDKIKIPKLIWYIILGILISPSVLGIVDKELLAISSTLRQIALVIILTRSGLSLDLDSLKSIGRPAILMCFVPACFEILAICLLGPLLLNISFVEALLLGSVLAAVSPAVVVPRIITLKEQGYGSKHHVGELILAGASCDDIFVIILFYSFKQLVTTNNLNGIAILQIPTSIILGIILGVMVGYLISKILKVLQLNLALEILLVLSHSCGMIYLESALSPYVSISALLGIIAMGIMLAKLDQKQAREIQKGYNSLWAGFEIILFTLVGCVVDLNYVLSSVTLYLIAIIIIALIARSLGVVCCLLATDFNAKERLYIIISYLPKATVQASIAPIALSEGLSCGSLILSAGLISILLTAPIGAILMDNTYKTLLKKE